MAETKNCPYCGGEILAVAKKCKHCGQWLDGNKPIETKQMTGTPVLDGSNESKTTSTPNWVFYAGGIAILALLVLIAILSSKKDSSSYYDDYYDEAPTECIEEAWVTEEEPIYYESAPTEGVADEWEPEAYDDYYNASDNANSWY